MVKIKIKLVKVLLLLPLILLSLPITNKAQSNDKWKLIGESRSGTWFYKADTLTKLSGEVVKVWTKEIPKQNEGYAFTYKLMMFNCVERKSRLLSVVKYNEEGRVLEDLDFVSEGLDKWHDVVPGSVGEGLLEFFCK